MTYDAYKLATPEEAYPERECAHCGEWFSIHDLEPIDGLELCPGCLEIYSEEREVEFLNTDEYEPGII